MGATKIKPRRRSTTSHKSFLDRNDQHELIRNYEKCHEVINTAELLEMILLAFFESEVPSKREQQALLRVQRVSHIFEDAIKSSVKLQRALCFLHDPSMTLEYGQAFISPSLLPHSWVRNLHPIGGILGLCSLCCCQASPGASFAAIVFDKRLAPKEFQTWQKVLVMQGAKEDYWVTLGRLPFVGLIPKHQVDVKCGQLTTAGELMRMAREKFWNNGVRDGDLSRTGAELSKAAGGSKENAIVL